MVRSNNPNDPLEYELKGQAYVFGLNKENKDKELDIVIPDTVVIGTTTYNVYSIGTGAFNGNKIKSVIISKNITSIGDSAFENCNNLRMVTFQGDKPYIGMNAFKNLGYFTYSNFNNELTSWKGINKIDDLILINKSRQLKSIILLIIYIYLIVILLRIQIPLEFKIPLFLSIIANIPWVYILLLNYNISKTLLSIFGITLSICLYLITIIQITNLRTILFIILFMSNLIFIVKNSVVYIQFFNSLKSFK